MDSEELLSQLLTALAVGARAVQGIPLDDEFEYQSSFPEFNLLVEDNQQALLEVLLLALGDESLSDVESLDDPLLWESCVDVCERLLEQAEGGGSTAADSSTNLVDARNQAQSTFGRLMAGIVEMTKPQETFPTVSDEHKMYDRRRPWIPNVQEKHHAIKPLDLNLHDGHGLENRFGGLRNTRVPQDVVAPAQFVQHVYETEISNLEFPAWQLEAKEPETSEISKVEGPLTATWVDTPRVLGEMVAQLETATEVAIDLEAHSYRSFAGMTCLIQLTFSTKDAVSHNFLVDPFPLWRELQQALGPILANPNVVKVLHGADSDIQWLQRDFGLYIVNLFDTGRAARALQLQSAGYAYLLQHYAGVTADKSHQLSDWRQRPLPEAMKEYAIADTHYLLIIYHRLKFDLEQSATTSVLEVFKHSQQVSLIRYAPEPFKPSGYQTLMHRRGRKTELNETQEHVLRELWDWRDQVARNCDESLAYVCPNNSLLRISLACPSSLTILQGLLQPMPPLVLRYAKQVLGLVQRCVKPPFFKPATVEDPDDAQGDGERTLMSPVLGTEALYHQAGWISPYIDSEKHDLIDEVTTTEDDDNEKAPRVLGVHESNDKYRSDQYMPHSIHLADGGGEVDEEAVADGMGPIKAAGTTDKKSLHENSQLAKSNADKIRRGQEGHAIVGLMSVSTEIEPEDEDGEPSTEKAMEEEEFPIPLSMREIYQISNRNRRNKKSVSPQPPETDEKELEELARAEEVLKARSAKGKNYFDEIPVGMPKRQRTKSSGTASLSSDEAMSQEQSREEDIDMMISVGWVKDKDEVEQMMKDPLSTGQTAEEGDVSSDDEAGKAAHKPAPFDYSNVGPIGAFSTTPPPNPFFQGVAAAGGPLNQQFGKPQPTRKKQSAGGGRSRQSRRQVERPERQDGRAQAYKKR